MGPVVSADQRDKIFSAVTRAVEQGCTVLTGGDQAPSDLVRTTCGCLMCVWCVCVRVM